MHISHLAVWTTDLERLKVFYQTYFDAHASEKYKNEKTGFESYFLEFEGGCRLEIMRNKTMVIEPSSNGMRVGLAHFAISLGNKEAVDELTERLRANGYEIHGNPRTTGDGYYESVVSDPDGNRIELTISIKSRKDRIE